MKLRTPHDTFLILAGVFGLVVLFFILGLAAVGGSILLREANINSPANYKQALAVPRDNK